MRNSGHARVLHRLAARIPADLLTLRAKAMLEATYRTLGVADVECPACHGTGWADCRTLTGCPICCGFKAVPQSLAAWFSDEWSAMQAQANPLLPYAAPVAAGAGGGRGEF